MIPKTETITLSFSVNPRGEPMAYILDASFEGARDALIEWLGKYGASKGAGPGAIFDLTHQSAATTGAEKPWPSERDKFLHHHVWQEATTSVEERT
jgi:predicted RNA-binding protein with PIN domain